MAKRFAVRFEWSFDEDDLRLALADILNDPAFTSHLAEEIADRLDGINDAHYAAILDEAANSPLASEIEIQEALKR